MLKTIQKGWGKIAKENFFLALIAAVVTVIAPIHVAFATQADPTSLFQIITNAFRQHYPLIVGGIAVIGGIICIIKWIIASSIDEDPQKARGAKKGLLICIFGGAAALVFPYFINWVLSLVSAYSSSTPTWQ